MSEHLIEERRAILKAALGHAAFDGWAGALNRAVSDCGYDRTMAARAFPGGTAELIEFYMADSDRAMLAALEELDLDELRMRERIARAVRTRLEAVAGQREAIRRAIAFQTLPGQNARALRGLYRTVDAIWRACGDTATDFNFYTKRGLLAGVYASTLLFWLNDKSEDFADSWDFLDRRIDQVMTIQKATGRLKELRERMPRPWRLLGRLRYGFSA
jgi:ubiquinone biosynthesis protein COQ9